MSERPFNEDHPDFQQFATQFVEGDDGAVPMVQVIFPLWVAIDMLRDETRQMSFHRVALFASLSAIFIWTGLGLALAPWPSRWAVASAVMGAVHGFSFVYQFAAWRTRRIRYRFLVKPALEALDGTHGPNE